MHSAFAVHESAQKPSTQKPFPAAKLQQSPLRVQLELTARHVAAQLAAGEQALAPLSSVAQHPLLHWLFAEHASAQRPLTQKPSLARKEQHSPLAAQTPPVPTHAGDVDCVG
jgi:hypothetical protein